jgi:hypothetical protein
MPAKVAFAATLLKNAAVLLWEKHGATITTWAEFCSKLTAEFTPINEVKDVRNRLASLIQTTSVQDHIYRFRTTVLEIPGITEDEQLDRFIRGLKFRTQREVILRNPTTLQDAMETAQAIDAQDWEMRP